MRPTGRWLPPAKGVKVFQKFFGEIQRKNCPALKVACLWQELLGEIVGASGEAPAKREEWLERALDFLEHSELGSGTDCLRQAAKASKMK